MWAHELAGRGDGYFKYAKRRFEELGIPYFVTGGTLLGLVRDGGLIDSDTDIDFAVDGSAVTEKQIRDALAQWPLAREVRKDGEVQQLCFYPDKVIVDVHFYRKDGDSWCCRHLAGVLRLPGSTFDGHEMLETKFGPVRVPANPRRYLKAKYGDDWTIPKHQKKGRYADA